MKRTWAGIARLYAAVGVGVLALAIGCSEERKAKAARLERQMLGQADSIVVDSAALLESATASFLPDSVTSLVQQPETTPPDSTSNFTRDASVEPVDSSKASSVDLSVDTLAGLPALVSAPISSVVGAAPVLTDMPASMPRDSVRTGYVVQLLSTPSRAYADSQVAYFSEQGYLTYAVEALVEGRTVYRVRVSAGESFQTADSLRQQIQDRYALPGFVTKVTR